MLPESNLPLSHDTFGRVFRWLDAAQFQTSVMAWTQSLCQLTGGQLVTLDGKKLRRSHDKAHERDGIWMVSAWVSENQLVLGQQKVEAKSNEISASRCGMALPDITGCVVTIDAVGTQADITRQLVKQPADYILPVKENQGSLYEDRQLLFDGFEQENYVEVPHDTAKLKAFLSGAAQPCPVMPVSPVMA